MAQLSRDSEADRMIELFGGDFASLHSIIERQFGVLMARAQVLLGLCGVVVTTTGFSGRIIAGTNALAQGLIIGGISLTLASAAIVVFGVLPLRWLTQQPGSDIRAWLISSMAYRDGKLVHYRVAVVCLLIGLMLYVGAIGIMLVYPEADAVKLVR